MEVKMHGTLMNLQYRYTMSAVSKKTKNFGGRPTLFWESGIKILWVIEQKMVTDHDTDI